jgi:hypothetical protein
LTEIIKFFINDIYITRRYSLDGIQDHVRMKRFNL